MGAARPARRRKHNAAISMNIASAEPHLLAGGDVAVVRLGNEPNAVEDDGCSAHHLHEEHDDAVPAQDLLKLTFVVSL